MPNLSRPAPANDKFVVAPQPSCLLSRYVSWRFDMFSIFAASARLPPALRSASSTIICSWAARSNPSTRRSSSIFRSEEHTSELQSLMRISYAVFCLKKKHIVNHPPQNHTYAHTHHLSIHTYKT